MTSDFRDAMNAPLITIDIDWAPDFAIDFAADILIEHRVRTTWFVTHASLSLERLRSHSDLFELGIHPNFLPGSTHGDSPASVLRHCMAIVPEATSVRTHSLVQSTPLLRQILAETPINTDVSIFLGHAPFRPVEYHLNGRTLLRVPYCWEDDFEMEQESPCWRLAPPLMSGPGLKVFDFHPVHIYLNSSSMAPYQEVRKKAHDLTQATRADLGPHIQSGRGARSLFVELVELLAATGQSLRISDIHARWSNRDEQDFNCSVHA